MKIGLLILAAGLSQRFGGHKLLHIIEDRPMYELVIDKYKDLGFSRLVIVTIEEEIANYATKYGFITIINDFPEYGQSRSIILGVKELMDMDAIMISVCDQPNISSNTIRSMINNYIDNKRILAIRCGDRSGSPNIFGNNFFNKLMSLTGDQGGRIIIKENRLLVDYFDIMDEKELNDIDTKKDLDEII